MKFSNDAEKVAKKLLGKILKVNSKRVRIVETEAYYDENDPASRARQNGDLCRTMKMKAGTILVYGCHNNWLLNIVTGKEKKAEAVLIRAGEPLNFSGNCKGPGLLTRELKIDKSFHKKQVGKEVLIENAKEKFEIEKGWRVGVKEDLNRKLRFWIKNNRYVSR